MADAVRKQSRAKHGGRSHREPRCVASGEILSRSPDLRVGLQIVARLLKSQEDVTHICG